MREPGESSLPQDINQDTSIEESRKAEMRTEFGSLRRDWFERKGINLEGKKYSELKSLIKEFYSENEQVLKETLELEQASVEGELSTIARQQLDFDKIAEIRKKIGLPKWVSLAETVAFIKTTLDLGNDGTQEKYVDYATKGISLDDMRNVLAFENDVKPARLDTDIYHQSPERSRSGVEIVSNAVDAVNTVSYTIGRFGVGFYQILSHLKSEKDHVKVKTGNDENGFYEIDFRLKNGEIQFHLEELGEDFSKGTSVELFVEDFPKEEAEGLIKKHFAYNNVANISCNGKIVNDMSKFGSNSKEKPTIDVAVSENGYTVRDDGIGMSPQVILEKLLVPKLSGKKPVQELRDIENITPGYLIEKHLEDEKDKSSKVVLSVGGVVIEEIELKGINTHKTLVIDLPPFTLLGEERNKVAIDDVTILAMKKLISQIVGSGDIQTINSLTPVIAEFQNRSLKPEEENNLVSCLQKSIEEKITSDVHCLPNIDGFDRIQAENAILIDPIAKQTNWGKIPEFSVPELSGSGRMIYVAPMTEQADKPVVIYRNRVILSKEIYEKFKEDPTLINLYLESLGKGEGTDIRNIIVKSKEKGDVVVKAETEKKEYSNFGDYILKNWQSLGYPSLDNAEESLNSFKNSYFDAVFEYIIPNFPENVTNKIISLLLHGKNIIGDEQCIKNIATLASNPELLKTMEDLDIGFRYHAIQGLLPYKVYAEKQHSEDKESPLIYRVVKNAAHKRSINAEKPPINIDYSLTKKNVFQLKKDGTVFYKRELNLTKDYQAEFWRDALEYEFADLEVLEEGRKKFMLWKMVQPVENPKTLGKPRTDLGEYEETKICTYETVLFDEKGNKIFQLKPNETVHKTIENNGEIFFIILQRKDSPSAMERWGHYNFDRDRSDISDIYYIDSSGNRLSAEKMKKLREIHPSVSDQWLPLDIDLCHGDNWKIKFGRDKELGEIVAYINRNDGSPVIEGEVFSSITYDPSTKLWRCFSRKSKDSIKEDKKETKPCYYIDAKGTVVTKRMLTFSVDKFSTSFMGVSKNLSGESIWFSSQRLLIANHGLSAEKTSIMNRVLEGYEIQEKEMMEKFIAKSFHCAELSDQVFGIMAPILLRINFVNPKLLNDDRILYLNSRLEGFTLENKVVFYDFLSQMLPNYDDEKETDYFIEKFIKIFQEKVSVLPEPKKESLRKTFDEDRDYDADHRKVKGWDIIRSKTPIGSELIPEKIRPILDYMRSDEKSGFGKEREPIPFAGSGEITLSRLIQTKRLNESRVQDFSGTASEFTSFVGEKTNDKKQDHIQREIIHPIYYQSVNNPYLFIRELVQNAHDAVIKDKSLKDKDVSINIFSRSEKDISLRIEDPVGMSLKEVLNYFLIPGETTKLGDRETIGYFGQGLFTLFRDAKEVVMKTSKGDGKITKLRISPLVDDKGMIIDLRVELEEEVGDFRGTIVERTVETEFPEVEAAYIKNAACTYTSLIDSNVINVNLNELQINKPQKTLAQVNIPKVGNISLLDTPNNVVVQRGLFVKPFDKDFATDLRDVEELLEKRGSVISIPDKIALTRSRNEIARKEEVMTEIKEYLPLLKLKAYLEIFRQDIINGNLIHLDNLPYDYFYWDYPTSGSIVKDAEKLKNGEPITNLEPYLERGSLIKLLILLPVVELDGNFWSLAELKEASLKDKPPLEEVKKYKNLPDVIRQKLLEGKDIRISITSQRERNEREGRRVSDFSLTYLSKQPQFVQEQVAKQRREYEKMDALCKKLNTLLANSLKQKAIKNSFFFDDLSAGEGASAHATQGFKNMGWNLDHWKDWMISSFGSVKSPADREIRQFLETYSHEYAHIMEQSGSLTHNQDFYKKQAEVLSRIMYELLEKSVDRVVGLVSS